MPKKTLVNRREGHFMEAQFQVDHNQDRQNSKTNFKEFALREIKKGQGHHKPFCPGSHISSELPERGEGAESPAAPGYGGTGLTRRRPAGTLSIPTVAGQARPIGAIGASSATGAQ